MTDEIDNALSQNLAEFFEHGPGLRATTRTWISGRDRTNGFVYVSGLGGMGIGDMWFPDDDRVGTPGYDDAPDCVTKPTEDRREDGAMTGGRTWVSGDWPAIFARTAMGRMAPRRNGSE